MINCMTNSARQLFGAKAANTVEDGAAWLGVGKPRNSKTDKIISGVAIAVFGALAVALLAAGLATAGTGVGLAVSLPLVAAGLICALVALGVGIRTTYKENKHEIKAFIEREAVAAARADEQKVKEECEKQAAFDAKRRADMEAGMEAGKKSRAALREKYNLPPGK
jgi:hypothetical protein